MSKGLDIDDVDQLADKLAARLSVSRAEAMRIALANEIARVGDQSSFEDAGSLEARLKPLFDRIAARPREKSADKAFFDSLNDE